MRLFIHRNSSRVMMPARSIASTYFIIFQDGIETTSKYPRGKMFAADVRSHLPDLVDVLSVWGMYLFQPF